MIYLLCYLLLILGLFCGLYRLIQGPDTLNRVLAFDYITSCIVSLIALHAVQVRTVAFLELILIFNLVGFASIVSFMEIFFAKMKEKQDG